MSEPLRICGVDVGRTTCWCLFRADEPEKPAFASLGRRDQSMRDYLLAVAAMTRIVCRGSGVMWCEQPMGSFRRTIYQQGQIIGAIQVSLPTGWSFDTIGPTEWKSAVGLAGNASKAEVQDWALGMGERLPDPLDEHQADAYAVAYAAWSHGRRIDGREARAV